MIRILNLWSIVESRTWPEKFPLKKEDSWRFSVQLLLVRGPVSKPEIPFTLDHTSQLSSSWTELIWSWITCIRSEVPLFGGRTPVREEKKTTDLLICSGLYWLYHGLKIDQTHYGAKSPDLCKSFQSMHRILFSHLNFSPPCPPHSSVSWRVPHVAAARCRGEKVGSSEKPPFLEIERKSPKLPRLVKVILLCKIASSYDIST